MDFLTLTSPKIYSFVTRSRILSLYSSPEEVTGTLIKKLPISLRTDAETDAKLYRSSLEKLNAFIVSYYDIIYPPYLREIYDPPPNLFCIGDPSVLERKLLAVVGTRSPSPVTRLACGNLTSAISSLGYQGIVSGLAIGVDAAAMECALENNLSVLGVMGTGPDREYPYENKNLYRKMKTTAGALVVTEYPPGFQIRKYAFPRRNRIITGISDSLLVMEAPEKSGAISSAYSAVSQNREVYIFDHPAQFSNQGGKKLLSDGANEILFPLFSGQKEKFFHANDILPTNFQDLPATLSRLGKEMLDGNWIDLGNGFLRSET
ncbi:putative DNA protecting protein DprA [Leptospira inadai serovar Lyme str. 10]|uniref:DNA processing protein DprA n=2 Tax=Leptospira inadai serovar Lyme TaxID=293084 RepID=A0ABX4YG03_9LEPT|nr:DNA-processing protein DprA [Leptospira inadai]EQA38225.1 putative DNA protecting protein DprA [Leptospira inadai serovar Lyme str. 10]PNV74012.1 DNA processing protein DprA [Leptospira inadai serovar Lyme]